MCRYECIVIHVHKGFLRVSGTKYTPDLSRDILATFMSSIYKIIREILKHWYSNPVQFLFLSFIRMWLLVWWEASPRDLPIQQVRREIRRKVIAEASGVDPWGAFCCRVRNRRAEQPQVMHK
jgi:hypothetical protein